MSLDEIYECVHNCQYCDSFTGNEETGCKGAPKACPHFRLDVYTAPEWATKYAFLFDGEDER